MTPQPHHSRLFVALFVLLFTGSMGTMIMSYSAAQTATDPKADCTAQGYKWCLNSDGVSGWCNQSSTGTCPAYTESDCSGQGGKWCKNYDGASGWCNTAAGSTCPAYTAADCTAQGKTWCTSTTGGSGWCSDSCPTSTPATDSTSTTGTSGTTAGTDPKADCTAKGYKWCLNSDGASGWCNQSSTGTCPAYTESDCAAQAGKWCKNSSGGMGWCNSDPNYVCPASSQSECTVQGGKWCQSSYGSGWCSSDPKYVCPAATESECSAQGGEWCVSTGTAAGGGWCNSVKGSCPINDKAGCESRGRKWCLSNYGGSGWCAMTGESCPSQDGTTPPPQPPPTPIPTMTWPTSKTECLSYYGNWCPDEMTSGGWCTMATKSCPPKPKSGFYVCWDNTLVPMSSTCPNPPSSSSECLKTAKYWCLSSGGGQGWCSHDPCMAMPPAGQMVCPDGKTFVSDIGGCPRLQNIPPPPGPLPLPEPQPLPKPEPRPATPADLKRFESERQTLLRDIKTFERQAAREKAVELAAKAAHLRVKLEQLAMGDDAVAAFEALRSLRDDLYDLRSGLDEIREGREDEAQKERERKMQEEQLRRLREGLRYFERYLDGLAKKVSRIEAQKIKVNEAFKRTMERAREMAKQVKAAKSFDDVRDLVEEIPLIAEELNDELPKLEQLSRLPRALRVLRPRLAAMEREITSVAAFAKRTKVDAAEETKRMRDLLTEAKAALEKATSGAWEGDDLFEYLEASVIAKLSEVSQIGASVRAIANVKQRLGRATNDLRLFERQIARLVRQKKDVKTAQELLAKFRVRVDGLRTIAAKPVAAAAFSHVVDLIGEITELGDGLRKAIGLSGADTIGRDLQRILGAGGEDFDSLEVDRLISVPEEPAEESGR